MGAESVTPRPRVATVWLAGCAGCHMSFVDLDERLIALAERVTLLASPLTDFKEFLPADVTLVEGAVALEEHVAHLKHIRERTKVLVAFGDCAATGNVPALRNVYGVEDVLHRAYQETATTIAGLPGESGVLSPLLPRVLPLHQIVKVDHYLPGCPPSADAIFELVMGLLEGTAQAPSHRRFG